MAAINNIGSSTHLKDVTERGTKVINAEESIGKDAFLQLLVAQMQHQDPFNSQDPTQFISQMATFSSLEQMTNMNSSLELLLGVNNGTLVNTALSNTTAAIGKEVDIEFYNGESEIPEKFSGTVKSTFIKDGGVFVELECDGIVKEYPYDSIVKISM